ncbi:hypothetical protein ACXHQ0_16455 [Vibrio antiquarius]|uniref:Uncharacterized protein n=2 Tax=Vibrio parahaemolyticus TaxID=670 RepID=A0A8H9NEF7_VIBPH|nr:MULTISPECIES: hypothetical protein [Vibrio]EJG0766678.1 hypothetical protein [Vibrio parahaemolyticus O5:K30]EQM48721.1 hypothetical protein D051_0804 [Vibrio parahaemolyticus VPCR-2010]EGR3229389.1 hypothetical protein [Vibrio parahaemolyticus]EGR5926670.1 hypothetical protein [Vibrio parahaemolyticus]EJG0181244.1 hypothetical protein [Vibrio parahaemolyticus]
MSTTVKFVKPEHEEILREYLDKSNVALVFGKELQEKLESKDIEDGEEVDYDPSMSSDVIVEVVTTTEHPVMISALSEI